MIINIGQSRQGINVSLLCALLWPLAAHGQVQAGLAGWPGLGAQVSYINLHSMYTLEAGVQLDYDAFASRRALYVGGFVGAAILPLSIWRTIGQADYGYDLDLGVRFGPSLVFVEQPTRADKNQQFSLFIDPYLRYRKRVGQARRTIYVEVGPVRPVFRVGFWLGV